MPEIMKVHMRDASFLQYFLEHPKNIIQAEVPTMHIRKYKIAILPEKFIADVRDYSPKKPKRTMVLATLMRAQPSRKKR